MTPAGIVPQGDRLETAAEPPASLAGPLVAAVLLAVVLPAAVYLVLGNTLAGIGWQLYGLIALLGGLIGFMGGRFAASVVRPGFTPLQGAVAAGWRVLVLSAIGVPLVLVRSTWSEAPLRLVIGALVWTVVLTAAGAFFGFLITYVQRPESNQPSGGGQQPPGNCLATK